MVSGSARSFSSNPPIIGASRCGPTGNVASMLEIIAVRTGTGAGNSCPDVAGSPDLPVAEPDVDGVAARIGRCRGNGCG